MGRITLAQVAYVLFGRLVDSAGSASSGLGLAAAQSFLHKIMAFLQASLGPAEKMTFSMTHVLLAAQLIALAYYLERLRAAVLLRQA
jgi:hypothetical protein